MRAIQEMAQADANTASQLRERAERVIGELSTAKETAVIGFAAAHMRAEQAAAAAQRANLMSVESQERHAKSRRFGHAGSGFYV